MKIPYALRGEEMVDAYEFDSGGRKPGIICPGCKEPTVRWPFHDPTLDRA